MPPKVVHWLVRLGLVDKSKEALDLLSTVWGTSEADTVNRALQLAAEVEVMKQLGAHVLAAYPDGREEELRWDSSPKG